MKKIAVIIPLLLLSACSRPQPNTTQPGVESLATQGLQLTNGLQGCKLYYFQPAQYQDSISIVRCPNSSTTTTEKYMSGKVQKQRTVVTDDNERNAASEPNDNYVNINGTIYMKTGEKQ